MFSPNPSATRNDLVAGKPTVQSSVDPSGGPNAVDSVVVALRPDAGRSTALEMNPWWQTDLLDVYRIKEVRVFNSRNAPERLRFFSLLFSLDGAEWTRVFVKKNKDVFGRNDEPFTVTFSQILNTRYIRFRLDGYDYLNFGGIEAFGIRATGPVSSVGVIPQKNTEAVKLDELEIFIDRESYSDVLIEAIERGRYEHRERAVLKFALAPEDRVLEVGTALGVVSMLAARIVGPERILTFDGNPQMIEHARRNFAHNNLSGIRAENAILKNAKNWKGTGETVDFFISRNFWASGLKQDVGTVAVTTVEARCFEQVIKEHGANVLICDIEGGEVDLLMEADLTGIDTIMMEIHYSSGEAAANRLVRRLINSGFSIDMRATGWCVVLMYRGFHLKRSRHGGGNFASSAMQTARARSGASGC